MAKTLGLDRLPWTPDLGFGYLDSQHFLRKLWEGVGGLLPALSLNPKQLALGTHAAHGVPQGNQAEPPPPPVSSALHLRLLMVSSPRGKALVN